MRTLPLSIGTLHFVGIGGIGMSGIAEVLHNLGYAVQGSDMSDNPNVKRLRAMGIPVSVGHAAENVGEARVIVVSSAIKADNPEVQAARAKLLPVVRRAEMLGELMRLKWSVAVGGTHGKTTTTSLISAILEHAGLDPTVIVGGILSASGSNARLGEGDWMVVEADESDGTFVKLPATIAVVTNIDPEHLDFYGDFDAVRRAFLSFVQNIPFYGFAALCLDHPEVQALIPKLADRKIVTYGMSPQADVRAINVKLGPEGARFDVMVSERAAESGAGAQGMIRDLILPMYGRHNVQNACAAIAVAREMGLEDGVIREGLAAFAGVKRRFTKVGESGGVTVIDDYAHHPVEVAAVLRAAREAFAGKIVAVIQPHRYTRLRDLFEEFCTCFNDADIVIVADVYPAGEAPIAGIDRDHFAAALTTHGHHAAVALPNADALAAMIAERTQSGDVVVCLGAGSITNWAQALPAALDALKAPPKTAQGGQR